MHLYNSGCKRLAFIGMNVEKDHGAAERLSGFEQAAKSLGDSLKGHFNAELTADHSQKICMAMGRTEIKSR